MLIEKKSSLPEKDDKRGKKRVAVGYVKEAVLSSYLKEKPNDVRWARLRSGIKTQRELANMTGLNPSIISDLERGKRQMNANWAIRIAKVTGVDWKELISK